MNWWTKIWGWPLRTVYVELVFPQYKRLVVKELLKLMPKNARVLDVGCDDGNLAVMLMGKRPDLVIKGVDVQEHREAKIPRKLYDGVNLPYEDDSFDVVMVVDVLHHIKGDIAPLLKEMRRVTRKYVLIKDHMANDRVGKFLLSLADFWANMPFGVGCPFNFQSEEDWHRYFKDLNLKVVDEVENIYFGYRGDKRYHWMVLLEK